MYRTFIQKCQTFTKQTVNRGLYFELSFKEKMLQLVQVCESIYLLNVYLSTIRYSYINPTVEIEGNIYLQVGI